MGHLDMQTAIDYLEERYQEPEMDHITAHLEHCLSCQAEVEAARRFLSTAQGPALEPAPAPLMDQLVAAFRRRQHQPPVRQRQRMDLQFDSRLMPAPPGVRGGAPMERQLLYSKGTLDLDVQIAQEPEGDSFTIHGQLLDIEDAALIGTEVELSTQRMTRLGVTDDLGRFTFSRCPAGQYELLIHLVEADLMLSSLAVET